MSNRQLQNENHPMKGWDFDVSIRDTSFHGLIRRAFALGIGANHMGEMSHFYVANLTDTTLEFEADFIDRGLEEVHSYNGTIELHIRMEGNDIIPYATIYFKVPEQEAT